MIKEISKTQIDRLGDRLRKDDISDDDLRLLDLYRRDFFEAYEIVIGNIREKLSLEPTGRPAKSTTSISDKLLRESIRLSQIQDIAGCRLIVEDVAVQDTTVELLKILFENVTVVDRREHPSHGYRAVHVIVNCLGKTIEIQIRTQLQQLWAELSEKFSDVIDPAIKYGGGDKKIQGLLINASELVNKQEFHEDSFTNMKQMSSNASLPEERKQAIAKMQEKVDKIRDEVYTKLRHLTDDVVPKFKELIDDISD